MLTIRRTGLGGTGDGDEACAIRNAHVSRTGGPTLPDGDYKVSGGAPGTDAELSVFGEGAEVWWDGLFGTPVGGIEDDPALCAEVGAVASGIGDVFLGKDGRTFSSHSVSALDAVLFTGHFSGRTHGFGGYVATSYPVCAGTGALTWSLARRAPPLAPAVPLHESPPPRPKPPPPPTQSTRCAMRFQVQQGKATPHSWPVHAPRAITVKEAVAGLDALQSNVASGLRKASHQAFTDTRKWVVARPRHGGVSATGNVKRVFFKYQKKNWRLDTENLRCHNLTS